MYADEYESECERIARYTDVLFYIYRSAMQNMATFESCEEMDIVAYIDYLIFCIDHKKEFEQSEQVNE
ncbi:hypothetical protein [Clostridium sp. Marseille-Q2269]|uniref:hypothetical protein n=1 Tax=Clostridium sp. Marseille-Q2269 TaxID=2942205 RepID=UPI00207444B0|nr:hypothetical protein [Clostridium sp. Marseille-Q2269]